MTNSSVISSKGQVTIPQEVRARLGLKEGDRLEFIMEGGRTVIRPARSNLNPFDRYIGALGTFANEVEITAWIRELRDDDATGEK